MNVIQFWLIDSFLRHNPDKSPYAKVRTEEDPDISVDEGAPSTRRDASRDSTSAYVVGEGDDDDDEEQASGSSSRGRGGIDPVQDYGSTLKSPPLRPQTSRTPSAHPSLEDLRIEAVTVLSEGRAASVRTSSEGQIPPLRQSRAPGHGSEI